MVASANLETILKSYASKKNSAVFSLAEFCDYMHKYAQKYVGEQKELQPYVSNAPEAVKSNLALLKAQKAATLFEQEQGKYAIVVIAAVAEELEKLYGQIRGNPAIPYPFVKTLPKYMTTSVLDILPSEEFILERFSKPSKDERVHSVTFPNNAPAIAFPGNLPILSFIEVAVLKIREKFKKDDEYDYFLKKLTDLNHGKEVSVKSFFSSFTDKDFSISDFLENSSEHYYIWNQMCLLLRQDYEKIKDKTVEDWGIIQSLYLMESTILFYKEKNTKTAHRESSLKTLDMYLQKPPYCFSKKDICDFKDSKGVLLLGQYSQEDLNEYLRSKTTAADKENLPELLVFKTESGDTNFVMKNKVFQLILNMINEARENIKSKISEEWAHAYKNFEKLPEMTNQRAYEKHLDQCVKKLKPDLHTLLTSNFLSVLYQEMKKRNEKTLEQLNLFENGKLLPYTEILLLTRREINTDVKIKLPFWYSNPVIAWFLSLIMKKDKGSDRNKSGKNEGTSGKGSKSSDGSKSNKKEELKKVASLIEKKIVPQGSTLDKEMEATISHWNQQIDKKAQDQLTEDVNCFIRDYVRTTLRTLKISNFSSDAIKEMAEALSNSNNLSMIKEKGWLKKYITYYIINVIKHG